MYWFKMTGNASGTATSGDPVGIGPGIAFGGRHQRAERRLIDRR